MQADLSRRQTGNAAESQACHYLQKKGYKIIDRNFKTPVGEIDIIAKKDGMLHFFEVKARASLDFGGPFEAVTKWKQQRIRKTAKWFLIKHKDIEMPCLFGVIGVDLSENPTIIQCIVDAFE